MAVIIAMANELTFVARATCYPPAAFEFVQRGLEYTVSSLQKRKPAPGQDDAPRHVTGQDLCLGLRDYAISQYGLLARLVLRRWHITRSEDFGQIVFAMVDAGLMHKTEEDSIHDFDNVFDFAQAFAFELKPGNQP